MFAYNQVELNEHGIPRRRDPSSQDTTAYDYVQQVAVLTDENTHSGSDVAVYAMGNFFFVHKLFRANNLGCYITSMRLLPVVFN